MAMEIEKCTRAARTRPQTSVVAAILVVIAACAPPSPEGPAGDSGPDQPDGAGSQFDAGTQRAIQIAVPVRGGEVGNAIASYQLDADGLSTGDAPISSYRRARAVATGPLGKSALLAHAQGDDGQSRALFIRPSQSISTEVIDEVDLGDDRAPTAAVFVSSSEAVVATRGTDGAQMVTLSRGADDAWSILAEVACDEAPAELHALSDGSILTVQANDGARRISRASRASDGSYPIDEAAAQVGAGPSHAAVHPTRPIAFAGESEPATSDELNGKGLLHALGASPPFSSSGDPATLPYRALDLAVSPDGARVVAAQEIREWAPGGIVSVTVGFGLATTAVHDDELGAVDGEMTAIDAIDVTDMVYAPNGVLLLATVRRDESGSQLGYLSSWTKNPAGGWTELGSAVELDGSAAGLAVMSR